VRAEPATATAVDPAGDRAREPLPWRRLAALAAAAALLAPATWSAVSARLAPPPATPSSPLVALPAGGIDALEVRGGDVAGVFRRSADGWTFAPDGGAAKPVDADVPDGFLRTLAGLGRLTQFVDPDLAAFGLERPRGTFVLGGGPGMTIDIGNRNPTLTAVYVRSEPAPDVVLVGSVLLWEWDKLVAAARRSAEPVGEEGGSR